MPDYTIGQGDSLPTITAFLTTTVDGRTHVCTPDNIIGDPFDLTGCTAELLIMPDDGTGALDTRTVTIDPDQVANTGKVTFDFFDVGTATQALYNARVKVATALDADRVSFPNDRMIVVEVTPDPGSTP